MATRGFDVMLTKHIECSGLLFRVIETIPLIGSTPNHSPFVSTTKVEKYFVIQQEFLTMHCIKRCFDKIMHVLTDVLDEKFPLNGNIHRPGPKPLFSDINVIALSITAECLGIDSELNLFKKIETDYVTQFPNIISRRQYNDRRKSLFPWQEIIRAKMADKLNEIMEVFAIDSMPIEICKLSRMDRNKIGQDREYTAPDKGYCASQDRWYYGYKLHAACAPNGVIKSFDLSKASIHDVNFLKDVSHVFRECIITGDRGYINKEIKDDLWKKKGICMEVPARSNQKDKPKVLYVLKRIRKRIETVFSQLCDQFNIQRNYAKSFRGLKTRILAKVSGMTVLQYYNFINGRPIGKIKSALGV